jgi:hypothetical protein
MACLGSFTFLYVDDVRISRETNLWTPTACYAKSLIYLYAEDVRISQETQAFTVCYGDSFTFLYVEGVWEQGVEENIWTKEGWSDGKVEKAA